MINILGDIWGSSQPDWHDLLSIPNNKLHLYGKQEARVGRKMGHFNVLAASTEQAMLVANNSFERLKAD